MLEVGRASTYYLAMPVQTIPGIKPVRPRQAPAGLPAPAPGRMWTILGGVGLVAALAVTAICAGGSADVQQYHNSDTVIYSLTSTQAWTPFFWGQDRLGMFFSLVTMPIRDPLWNIVAVNILMSFCALASFVLLGWYFTDRRRGMFIGLLLGLILLISMRQWRLFVVLVAHPEYLGSLCLGLAGMLVLSRGRPGQARAPGLPAIALGGMLILLGCWVNVTIPLTLIPFALGRYLAGGWPGRDAQSRAGCFWSVAWSVLGLAAVKGLAFALKLPSTAVSQVSLNQWADGWRTLLGNIADFLSYEWPWRLLDHEWDMPRSRLARLGWAADAVLCAIAMLRLCRPDGRRALAKAAALSAAQAIPAVLLFLLVGTLEHVRVYEYGFRYALLTAALLASAVVTFAVVLCWDWLSGRRGVVAISVLAALMVATAWKSYGLPREGEILQAWDARWGERARDIIRLDCTHAGGHSWHTWDTVFYTNLLLYRSGSDRQIYGWAFRANQTRRLWQDMPKSQIRLASMGYDWLQDCDHLQRDFPPIDPSPIASTPNIDVHVPE